MTEETGHWAQDPYWTDALHRYGALKASGQISITVDLAVLEAAVFKGDGLPFRLMSAMCSVREHEGLDGCRGATRLVLALLAKLDELQHQSVRKPDM